MIKQKTYYEILGVTESCTQDEVRFAFLGKSKKHHPDKNLRIRGKNYTIVAINEAYSTLGKVDSRARYDRELANSRVIHEKGAYYYSNGIITNAAKEKFIFRDSSLYGNQDKSQYKSKENSYYGIKGVKRVSNGIVAAGVVLFMITGAAVQYLLASASATYSLKQLDGKTDLAGRAYTEVKERAKVNGFEKQKELLLKISKRNSET